MFRTARINNPIYILNKAYNPTLETGFILSVSNPRPPQPNPNNPYQYQSMVVDIVAQFGTEKRNLNGLPADQDFIDFPQGNMLVTINKNQIVNEVKSQYQQEEAKVNGYEHSKDLMGVYSNMLDVLDPDAAERKRSADKIQMLESTLAQQAKMNEEILKQLQSLSIQNKELASQLDAGRNIKTKNKE